MTDALSDHESTVSIGGRTVSNLRFADDIDGLAGSAQWGLILRFSEKVTFTKFVF